MARKATFIDVGSLLTSGLKARFDYLVSDSLVVGFFIPSFGESRTLIELSHRAFSPPTVSVFEPILSASASTRLLYLKLMSSLAINP